MSRGTVTARLAEETAERLDRLAAATKRSRSWLVEQAVAAYLDDQAWQVEAIREGLAQADAGEFADDAAVGAALRRQPREAGSMGQE